MSTRRPTPAHPRLALRPFVLGAGLLLMTQLSMAAPIDWYERPGQWFRNLLYAPRASQAAPSSLGRTLTGEPATVERGDGVLLLVFWASWCPYCREELPQMDKLVGDIGDPRFKVLAVNVYDDVQEMARWIGQRPWQMTFLVDKDGAVAKSYAISPLPTNVLVDAKTRRILTRWEGLVDPIAIAAEVNRHLKARTSAN
jgi:thiol-disulfide isomerase/thioredoxin